MPCGKLSLSIQLLKWLKMQIEKAFLGEFGQNVIKNDFFISNEEIVKVFEYWTKNLTCTPFVA